MKDWFDIILICIVCVGLMFLATTVMAVDVQVGWTPPETRVDGSVIADGEIQGYRVYLTRNGVETAIDVPGELTTTTLAVEDFGIYTLQMTTIADVESDRSSPVSFHIREKLAQPATPVMIIRFENIPNGVVVEQ